MSPARVLVVDDSAVIRRLVTGSLESDPEIEVVGTANDGQMGLDRIAELRPDLVTLDIEMPVMDGLTALRLIRRRHPKLKVIMFSTLTENGASSTLEALSLGASDYVTKPSNVGSIGAALERVKSDLIPKIKALCSLAPRPLPALGGSRNPNRQPATSFDVVAIASSTGGPMALREVLDALPASFPLPILVTQHMPPIFTQQLADRLDRTCALSVREATHGMPITKGSVLIAPGGKHLTMTGRMGRYAATLSDAPPENFCRPSADVMFRSVAASVGGRALVVMLTGMGDDGVAEAGVLHDRGARVVAQDEATSVVWGMPGQTVATGAADVQLPLSGVADEIVSKTLRSANRLIAQR